MTMKGVYKTIVIKNFLVVEWYFVMKFRFLTVVLLNL